MKLFKAVSGLFILSLISMLIFLPSYSSAGPLDNWHQRSSPTTNTLWSVTNGINSYGINTLVAVGGDEYIEPTFLESVDGGKTWLSLGYIGFPKTYSLFGVCYHKDKNGDIFVAVGTHGEVLTSFDGGAWLPRNSSTQNDLYAVSCTPGICAAGAFGTIDCASSDGTFWTLGDSYTSEDLMGITCPPNALQGVGCVAVGSKGAISRNGSGVVSSKTTNDLLAVAYGNNTYVAVGLFSTILTSPDGITWTVRNISQGGALGGITYGNNIFMAVGTLGTIITSPDGKTWTSRNSGTSLNLHGVNYDDANKTFTVVGDNGEILQSDNVTTVDTPTGTNVKVSPPTGVTITFTKVTSPGTTSYTTSSIGSPPPPNFQTGNPPTYYNIQTTAGYTPPVKVCIKYDPAQYSNPNQAKLLHWENNQWKDVTISNDTTNHIVCGQVNSLSPFTVAERTEDKPPVISGLSASPSVLWPPDNKMTDVTLDYSVTDDWDIPACEISVTSDEPVTGADYLVTDANHLKLRSQRSGAGGGRNYVLTLTCVDGVGNATSQDVTVTAPHDRRAH